MADTLPAIEVDSNAGSFVSDSAFEDGTSTASASLASSVIDYVYENGRRYHAYRKGQYVLPNDPEEQDRLDLGHHLFRLLLGGKLFQAPIDPENKRVLDIGTGTGIWAIDVGDEYPNAQVIGTDLSPIQPTWIPPNVRFYVDDAESDWVYPADEAFDLIHGRGLSGAIGDWDRLIRQSFNNLKPGGWLEFHEAEAQAQSDDDTVERAVSTMEFVRLCNDAARQFGREVSCAHLIKDRMINAGFVDVTCEMMKVPIGVWSKSKRLKEIGRFQGENCISGVEPYTLGFIGKGLGWTELECKVFVAKVIAELRDPKNHFYSLFYFVHGKKPE
ncbi:methyltransferase [Eremomyces bilateralis CBS 781.70]|uniref:Methyltransferase n=1 Tax=Eremomyces bilateralis CBS 781.70 TaxID=1392243 RepID=A0A6G1FXQ7_9PEZI|nr:methyltransferase [Eremomyces bilateralis CBS 781.70]KAF1810538.1 methyltransferase [Eremomyces bilateralis CBS 781.70]